MLHLCAFLKKWYKNPTWSFSCCLSLILPFLSLSGDIDGLVGENMMNNQGDTGDIEMPSIGAAVQDSGATDITLDNSEQPATQLQIGEKGKHTATILSQFNEAFDISVEENKQENGSKKEIESMQPVTWPNCGEKQSIVPFYSQYRSSKCHRETQTTLMALNWSIEDVKAKG